MLLVPNAENFNFIFSWGKTMEPYKGFSIGDRVDVAFEGPGTVTGWDRDSIHVRIDADGVEVAAAWGQVTVIPKRPDFEMRLPFTAAYLRWFKTFLRRKGASKRAAGWFVDQMQAGLGSEITLAGGLSIRVWWL